MSKPTFINSKVVYHDNSTEYNIDARGKDLSAVLNALQTAEDITPAEETPSDIPESIIFTKKAKKEGNIHVILQALQHAVDGRNDKTRAFVQELRSWQKEQYIDAHFNARIMYDELDKLIPLTFGYDSFRKYYNNLI